MDKQDYLLKNAESYVSIAENINVEDIDFYIMSRNMHPQILKS